VSYVFEGWRSKVKADDKYGVFSHILRQVISDATLGVRFPAQATKKENP
jgi:hypothetical protein